MRVADDRDIGLTGDGGAFASGTKTLPNVKRDRSSESSSSKEETGVMGEGVCGDGDAGVESGEEELRAFGLE